jgi:hypothetical protein
MENGESRQRKGQSQGKLMKALNYFVETWILLTRIKGNFIQGKEWG